jgi:asparagine synthase (glutamine-hydrolysing)
MCGILGYTHISRQLASGVLDAGIASLRHRGPDQNGRYVSQSASLGATRLRIIDLENGDQPLRSHDGGTVVVFNGEIYNHTELREELQALGAHFQSRCDTEVILKAWLQWGTACFARFRGMFAIAIWIEQEKRLVLARDRMGIKPLYYARLGNDISFGSELKCIFADPQMPRTIDLAGLNCFLSLNYVPAPFTLASGISKLMPGYLLDWRKGRIAVGSYVPPATRAHSPASIGEASEELDGLMRKSTAEQMVSDVPLGIWLSGGLDSSSVLHYAATQASRPLKTFSITFNGKSFDESSYIEQVSRQYGTDHTEFDLTPQDDLADVIGEMAYYSDEPSADAGAVPVWYLSRMTRREVTAVLSGEGADELFGGYLTYKADRYRSALAGIPTPLKKAALRCAQALPATDEKIGFEYKIKRFLEGLLMPPEAAHVFWNGAFSEEEKSRFFHYADSGPLRSILGRMRPGQSLERFLDFDRRYSLPDGILYKVDRMSMAHAVEVRPPFLDDRIVDFAARLPRSFKIAGLETKVVLRRLMRGKLPESVLRRPKIGFDIPIHEWFRGPLRPLLEQTLSESALNKNGLFHAPAVQRLVRAHLDRRANWGYHLWGLVTLLLWMERWKIEVPETLPFDYVPQGEVFVAEPSLVWQPAQYSAGISESPLA